MRRASGPEHFYAMHRHGFVRVATSTPRVRPADVGFNRDAILEEARRADAAKVDLAVFPELCVSSYAIDDLHLQAALLDAVEAGGRPTSPPRAPSSAPVLLIGAPLRRDGPALQLRAGDRARQAPRRRAEELPAQLPRILREALVRPRPRPRRADDRASPGQAVPFGTDLIFAAGDLAGLRLPHRDLRGLLGADPALDVRRRWPAPPILANLSASNITIGKADERHTALRARSRRAPSPPTSTPPPGPARAPPTSPGTARARSTSSATCSPRSERFPTGAASSAIADVDVRRILGSSGCACGTFNDNAAAAAGHPETPFRRVALRAPARASPTSASMRPLRRFPYVPNRPDAARPGLLRGLQHPGRRACAAASRRPAASTSSSASRAGSIRPTR